MNNSLPRLIDGMVSTLRKEIIPHVEGEYARGQAFGVIYMLNALKLRASWSNEFLAEQLRALNQLSQDLTPLEGVPAFTSPPPLTLPAAADLEAARNEGDRRLCELVDWLAEHSTSLSSDVAGRADRAINAYLNRQSKYELSTSAKPMFVEMSGGAEKG